MAWLEFSVLQLPEITDQLSGDRFQRLKDDLYALLLSQRIEVFASQGGASGPWKRLAASTIAQRRKGKKGSGQRILEDTHLLLQSFTREGAEGNVKETGGNEVRLATHVPYAAIQNFGGTISLPEQRRQMASKPSGKFGRVSDASSKRGGIKEGWRVREIIIPAHTVTIPARPFDEFSDDDKQEIQQLVDEAINGR